MTTVNIFSVRAPRLSGKGDQVVLYQRCLQLSKIESIKKIKVYALTNEKTNDNSVPEKTEVHYLKFSFIIRVLMFVPLLLRGLPIQSSIYYNHKMKKVFLEQNKDDITIILTSRLAYLSYYFYTPKLIIDMIDPLSKTYTDILNNSRNFLKKLILKYEVKKLIQLEKELTRSNAVITLVSSVDLKIPHLEKTNIYIVPIMLKGIKYEKYIPRKISKEKKKLIIGFHGNLNYYPNIEAVKFLINNIRPLIRNRGIEIICCGRNPSSEIRKLFENNFDCSLIIDPEDIFEIVAHFDMYVAPMFSGSGMQNKILEAAELKIPIITTNKGADPLALIHNKHCLIANTEHQFQKCILSLAGDDDLKIKLSNEAKNKVMNNYAEEKLVFQWQKILNIYNVR